MAEASERISAAALERLLEAFNAHDIDAVMSFFVSDCVLEMPRGRRSRLLRMAPDRDDKGR